MSFADADLARLLIALAVLLLAAHGVGSLFARFHQPPAIGEIVGGILLGPSALGAVFPAVQHWIFPATGSSAAALGAVYELGLLLLMFAAGAEMRAGRDDAIRARGTNCLEPGPAGAVRAGAHTLAGQREGHMDGAAILQPGGAVTAGAQM